MTRRARTGPAVTWPLRLLAAAISVALLVVAFPPPAAAAPTRCAGPAPGGDWPRYGRDLGITRSQPAERVIAPENVASLQPRWYFHTASVGGGMVHSTPVVSDGCVYFGTTAGWVFALNAESGGVVWSRKLAVGEPGLLCTGIVGSPALDRQRVFVIVSQAGNPYLAALERRSGRLLWRRVLDRTPLVYSCASPILYRGMVVSGFNGDQTGSTNRGGWAIHDAASGRLLSRTYTLPKADYEEGFRGGGVWATPAVDTATGYAYVGTSNPDAGSHQHRHADAILKFDLDRRRPTFGRIVGVYEGTPDRYLPLPDPPTCFHNQRGNQPTFLGRDADVYVRSVLCAQMDLDFGASPQIFRQGGVTYVGALQKSGLYHAMRADTMAPAWSSVLAPPFFYGNASTAATDGSTIFVGASLPGQMYGLSAAGGGPRWVSPIGDLLHYQGIAHANGLVFTTDNKGFLDVYRADNGLPLVHRPMHLDAGAPLLAPDVSSAGVAIARNTVYAPTTEYVIAYRLPAGTNP